MIRYTRFRFCPSCGGKQIEKFQDYGMRCQQCGYHYFHNAASAVSAIIETRRGIILIARKEAPRRGYLDLPGGFVGHGETLERALQRETREELNLVVKDLRYFGSFPNRYDYRGVTYFTIDAIFTCKAASLRAMMPREEVLGISIRIPGEIDTRKVAFSSARKALEKYRAVKG
ncbi:MAG: NUDIX domain-containing protein [Syntrophaceae bacterium]|nr:NUDIX domain-containing protein [Syntrophaceae bacterium]